MLVSDYHLTPGAIKGLFSASAPYPLGLPVVAQVLNIKAMEAANGGAKRLRLVIWDGEYLCHTIVRPECVPGAEAGGIQRLSVVTISKYNIERMQKNKHVLVIDELKVEHTTAPRFTTSVTSVDEYFAAHPEDEGVVASVGAVSATPPAVKPAPSRPNVFAIEQLSPYQNQWTIKARVLYKSDIRTWLNARGEGKLFNVNLLDESDEIRATMFNDVVDKFHDLLVEGKVYYISKARIQQAKPQWSNLLHPYELSFDRDTEVEECHDGDTDALPKLHFNFLPLSKVATADANTIMDALGVLKEVNPPFTITARLEKQYNRRDVVIVDESGYAVTVGLWNNQALEFDLPVGLVVAFKGAKVLDFGGKLLLLTQAATIIPSPDTPEAYKLKGWYDAQGASALFTLLKQERGVGSAERITIGEAQSRHLGEGEKPDYFNTKALVLFVRTENFAYPACASEGCNRKVVEHNDGEWRCEKCEVTHAAPVWRYVLTTSVVDPTGNLWVLYFDDEARKLIGVLAGDLMAMKDTNDEDGRFTRTMAALQMKELTFRLKARQDLYNGVDRVRYQVMGCEEVAVKQECDRLVAALDAVL